MQEIKTEVYPVSKQGILSISVSLFWGHSSGTYSTQVHICSAQ